jgi:hypothetical protein
MPVPKEEIERWFNELPDDVKPVAAKYPTTNEAGELRCYRSTDNERQHYVIIAYSAPTEECPHGSVRVVHGSDSALPGVVAFGIKVESLVSCGCGNWAPPTALQTAAMGVYLDAQRRKN